MDIASKDSYSLSYLDESNTAICGDLFQWFTLTPPPPGIRKTESGAQPDKVQFMLVTVSECHCFVVSVIPS